MNYVRANFPKSTVRTLAKALYGLPNAKIRVLGGIANSNYRVTTPKYDLVIKAYAHGQSTPEKIEKEVAAVETFRAHGVCVPSFVIGLDGKILQEYDGFTVVATKFEKGSLLSKSRLTPATYFAVGALTARVELAAAKIPVANYPCKSFADEFADVSTNWKYKFDLTTYNAHLETVKNIIARLDAAPRKVFLHRDIWPENLIARPNGDLLLLDFNDWSIGAPEIELANTLLQFGAYKRGRLAPDFDLTALREIMRGYRSVARTPFLKGGAPQGAGVFSPADIWDAALFICYLYFGYNAIQAKSRRNADAYLGRIAALIKHRTEIFNLISQ